jgi:hypothetical protein
MHFKIVLTRGRPMELVEFEWLRSIDAFSLVERTSAPEKRGKWGVQQQRVGSPPHVSLSTGGMKYFELYRPTEFPALFRQFADMPATAEGMRDFFNKFGPLEWGSERFGGVEQRPGWCSMGTDVRGALIHHANLRRAVELFEAGNLSALSVGFNQGGWGRLRAELRPGGLGCPASSQ